MLHRNHSGRAAVLRSCFDISSRPTAASWKVAAVTSRGFLAAAVVAGLGGLGGCALADDGGVAERSAVDTCRAAECVVDLEVSRDTGTYKQQLLLDGNREVSLLDGSALRVSELVPALALRLDRGGTGVITGLRPFSSALDVDVRARESPRPADGAQAGRVTGTIFHLADVLTTIRTAQGSIVTTPDHPFMTVSSGWTEAGKLEAGTLVITSLKDAPVRIVSVQSARATPTPVYNLTVAGTHTYFVGTESLLVHNMNTCGEGVQPRNPAQQAMTPPGALRPAHVERAKAKVNNTFDAEKPGDKVQFTDAEWVEIDNALTTLATSPGTKGGRGHGNNASPPLLPEVNPLTNQRIKYFEYDLSKHDGPRDGKRLIIGDDGSAYITGNHYHGFVAIKVAPGTLEAWQDTFRHRQDYTYHSPEVTNAKGNEKGEGSGANKGKGKGKDKGKGKGKGKK